MQSAEQPLTSSPRVLIVTLHSGEQELSAGTESIERQTVRSVEHLVISGLPNMQAHKALYSLIMERSEDFDFFVKLDADMVFRSETSLSALLKAFEDSELDHLVAPVFDVPSESNIHGVHLFRAGVKWGSYQNALFPDPNPIISGKRLILDVNSAAEVNHMPNPSAEQAFLFGVHRAIKIVQRDRVLKDHANARFQLQLLSRIASVNKSSQNNKQVRRLILLGAEWVFQSKLIHLDKKDGSAFRKYIERCLIESANRGGAYPEKNWLSGSLRFLWRRFRYSQLPTFWSLPGTVALRVAYRAYVSLGIRALARRGASD